MDVDTYCGHLCSRDLIDNEVITEAGELLGRVRGFKFNDDTDKVSSLIIGLKRIPLIPEQAISTYELPIGEIVSTGPNRLIVFEGAQERLEQLSIGILERLGRGLPPWERNKKDAEYRHPYNSLDSNEWGESDDDTDGFTPVPSPLRPGPRPGTNDSAELPRLEHEPRHHEGHQTNSKRTLLS